jgi:acyl-coenzyme A synthetase/AMP-(fatty) acid ligase
MRNIDKFIDTILNFGDRNAIYKENEIYTYSDLYNKIQYYNKKITETKISSGEVVFILGDYSIESIALFFILTFNNNIIVPITSENKDEINERFEVANPNWIINLKENSYTYFSENIEVERHNILINLIQQKIAGLILFSSGSTGKPKAMVHNLENLLSNYEAKKAKEMNFLVFLMFDQ